MRKLRQSVLPAMTDRPRGGPRGDVGDVFSKTKSWLLNDVWESVTATTSARVSLRVEMLVEDQVQSVIDVMPQGV